MGLRIVIADDHTIFREGLRTLITMNKAWEVAGEAANGVEAVHLADELEPDVVVMDLTMPVMNGIDATRRILAEHRGIKVLALSMETDRFFVVETLKAGASGYLLKDTAFAELSEAIRAVALGETYLPRSVATVLVRDFLQCIPADVSIAYQSLTPREREILQMIADGLTVKEIAYALSISYKTVENQRQAIMHKLQLFSVAHLTKFAVRHGLSSLHG